jgi:Bardet-Biedl syndrome 1 protein
LVFKNNYEFLDLTGDGEYRLVIADLGSGDFNMKLKVFKGTQMVSFLILLDFYRIHLSKI